MSGKEEIHLGSELLFLLIITLLTGIFMGGVWALSRALRYLINPTVEWVVFVLGAIFWAIFIFYPEITNG